MNQHPSEQSNPQSTHDILAALAKARTDYRDLVESMLNAFALHEIIVDEQGKPVDYRFLEVNTRFEVLTGLKRDEIIGKTVLEVLPKTEKYWIESYGSVALTGLPLHLENYSAEFDRHYEVNVYSPRYKLFAVEFQDVTQRKQMEIALKESERNLRLVFDNAGEGIWMADRDWKIVFINPEMSRITGYENEEIQGLDGLFFSFEEDLPFFQTARERCKRGITETFNTRLKRKDGTEVWVRISSTPILDNEGRFNGGLGLVTDITSRKSVLDELEQTRDLFKTFADQIPGTLFLKDELGRMVFVNQFFTNTINTDVLGKTADEYNPDLAKKISEDDARALHSGPLVTYEEIVDLEGRKRVFEVRKFPIHRKDKKTFLGGIGFDVTEIQQAQEEIRRSNELYSSVYNWSPLAFVLWDTHCLIEDWNQRAEEVFGWTKQEVLGKNFLEFLVPNHEQALLSEIINALLISDSMRVHTNQVLTKSGELITCRWYNSVILDSTGEPEKVLSVALDITKQTKAEQELVWQAKVDSALAELSRNLLEIGNVETICSAILAPALELTNSQNGFAGFIEPATGRLIAPTLTSDMWGQGELESGSIVYKEFTGLWGWVLSARLPLLTNRPQDDPRAAGTMEGHLPIERFLGVPVLLGADLVGLIALANSTRDYQTQDLRVLERLANIFSSAIGRCRLEEDRRKLEQQVQHSQKLESLGVLAGGIAHDFNNLLTGILGNADLALLELSEDSMVRDYVEQIERAALHAADLTRQMLAYSGKGKFIVEPLNLTEVVKDLAHLLEVSISKKAKLVYHFDDQLPTIHGDISQIRQIIMNLIINASEALGEEAGTISVSTGAQECDSDYLAESYLATNLPAGKYVFFEVTDTGCGMSPETKAKLFDPFFTTKFTGRGLGLAAVLGIVKGHHGSIKVYSELGKGSTLKVLLPAATEESAAVKNISHANTDWRGHGTILVVDDEEVVSGLAKTMLERVGFNVLIAEDGLSAVQIFQQKKDEIELVLLDLTMPEMDGEETFHHLREIRSDIRIILSSGYSVQVIENRFEGLGLSGFVQKPYRYRDLVDTVKKALSL